MSARSWSIPSAVLAHGSLHVDDSIFSTAVVAISGHPAVNEADFRLISEKVHIKVRSRRVLHILTINRSTKCPYLKFLPHFKLA
jgi:hypothetical protein